MEPHSDPCYCGSERSFQTCCYPFLEGKNFPKSAEQLMRSRYSAYAANQVQYIDQTNDPDEGEAFDLESAEAWAKGSIWKGLEIVSTEAGQAGDSQGVVEFKAHYEVDGKPHVHHEVSRFRFDAPLKRWFYVDGDHLQEPVRRTEPKVGRNDPCSCGSGKKFKKCCGAT